MLDLPIDGSTISLVWDGTTLHTTKPVQSDKPVQTYHHIRALRTDELEFDLQFEFTPGEEEGGTSARRYFHPTFDQPVATVTDTVTNTVTNTVPGTLPGPAGGN